MIFDKLKDLMNVKKDIQIYFIIYFFSYALILLNLDFIYWDDWTLVQQTKEDLIAIFIEAGNPLTGWVHYFILSFFGVYFYKVLVFICYFISGVLLNDILKNIKFLDYSGRVFIVAVFLVLPVNYSRIALITIIYTFCYLSFYLGFFVFSKYLEEPRKISLRFFALVLFFFSFQTNSFLVFYLLVFIYALYMFWNGEVKTFFRKILSLFDFWVLPMIFLIIKSFLLTPQGHHASYYSITKEGLENGLIGACTIFGRYYNELLSLSDSLDMYFFFVLLLLSLFLFVFIKKVVTIRAYNISFIPLTAFFLLGIFLSYLAMYPYMVIRLSPSFFDWDNRHMLLLPLGISICLYSIFALCRTRKYLGISFFISILAFCCTANIEIYYNFIVDGIKQDAILQKMKYSDIIRDNNEFLIYDETKDYDALKRTYRFYEYGGMLDKIYGNQNKYAVGYDRKIPSHILKGYLSASLKLKNYTPRGEYIKIRIERGQANLTPLMVSELLLLKLFDKNRYSNDLMKVVSLSVIDD